ncbi:MAG TPA: hypothetical protein DCM87_17920 [Planctomycetes bacterium]|nr:hypothetical protein [Planctomycetota bacterium]
MTRIDFACRAHVVEEMDRPDCPLVGLHRTLAHFNAINRMFSRYRGMLNEGVVNDMARGEARRYRLVDLGAGGCDIARWVVRRCRARRLRIAISAIEHDPRVAAYARAANAGYPEIDVVEADVLDRGILAGADFVFANHLLHHLSDMQCIELLRNVDRARPRRYLLNDLMRSPWTYYGFLLTTSVFFRNSFVCSDGLASIRRGFTLPEVRALVRAAAAVLPVSVRRLVPGRFVITGGTAVGDLPTG